MIVNRLSPGLANSIMELAAGIVLANINNQELILDISECQNSPNGYILDYLNIGELKKITRNIINKCEISHTDVNGIRKDGIFADSEIVQCNDYYSIGDSYKYRDVEKVYYMVDWFMEPARYFNDYWIDVKNKLCMKYDTYNVAKFKQLIKESISVGVHIRRGDMLLADFAIDMKGDYYKAAIEYMRRKINQKTLFYIFSDDIEYAESLLGDAPDIRYVSLLGYDRADLEEFICLSLCNHRILSNSSTYSMMANKICENKDKITIIQGDINPIQSLRDLYRMYYRKVKAKNKKNEYTSVNAVELDYLKIKKYKKKYIHYEYDEMRHSKIKEINSLELKENRPERILELLSEISFDYYCSNLYKLNVLLYKKMYALKCLGENNEALEIGDMIWAHYWSENSFRENYKTILNNCGYKEEAQNIAMVDVDVHYIIIPEIPTEYSCRLYGFGELGVCLKRLGNEVTIFCTPNNDTERHYISANKVLTNRHNIELGCKQILLDRDCDETLYDIIKNYITELCEYTPRTKVVVISRNAKIFELNSLGVSKVFVDFYENDPEIELLKLISNEEYCSMINKADYVVSDKVECSDRIIKWDNCFKTWWEEDGMWTADKNHRLSHSSIELSNSIHRKFSDVVE